VKIFTSYVSLWSLLFLSFEINYFYLAVYLHVWMLWKIENRIELGARRGLATFKLCEYQGYIC
jgi:hypothetical protein